MSGWTILGPEGSSPERHSSGAAMGVALLMQEINPEVLLARSHHQQRHHHPWPLPPPNLVRDAVQRERGLASTAELRFAARPGIGNQQPTAHQSKRANGCSHKRGLRARTIQPVTTSHLSALFSLPALLLANLLGLFCLLSSLASLARLAFYAFLSLPSPSLRASAPTHLPGLPYGLLVVLTSDHGL
jgi:hypothetical protein